MLQPLFCIEYTAQMLVESERSAVFLFFLQQCSQKLFLFMCIYFILMLHVINKQQTCDTICMCAPTCVYICMCAPMFLLCCMWSHAIWYTYIYACELHNKQLYNLHVCTHMCLHMHMHVWCACACACAHHAILHVCMHVCVYVACARVCMFTYFFSICLCTHVSQMWKGQTCWQLTMCVCAQHKKKHNKHNKPSER